METRIASTKQLENQTEENPFLNCAEQRTGSSQAEEHGLETREAGVEHRRSGVGGEERGRARQRESSPSTHRLSHPVPPDLVLIATLPFVVPL